MEVEVLLTEAIWTNSQSANFQVCRKGNILNKRRHTTVDAVAEQPTAPRPPLPGRNCHLLSLHSQNLVGLSWRKLPCSRWRPPLGKPTPNVWSRPRTNANCLPLSGVGSAPAPLRSDSPERQFSVSPVPLILRAPCLCPRPKQRRSHNLNAKF